MPDPTNNRYNPQKYFDMVSPGASAPSASSKPIIPSGLPPRRDPMMSPSPSPTLAPKQPASMAPAPSPFTVQSKLRPPDLDQPQTAPQPTTASPESNPPQAAAPLQINAKGVHHRLRIMLPLIIGLVVLFVVADLLIDANVIHTSVTPLTNFFHHH